MAEQSEGSSATAVEDVNGFLSLSEGIVDDHPAAGRPDDRSCLVSYVSRSLLLLLGPARRGNIITGSNIIISQRRRRRQSARSEQLGDDSVTDDDDDDGIEKHTGVGPFCEPGAGAHERHRPLEARWPPQEPSAVRGRVRVCVVRARAHSHLTPHILRLHDRERLGLKGLISLRLLAKDNPKEEDEGQPLDPKKTLREQGVVDGCDILVSQVIVLLLSLSPPLFVRRKCVCADVVVLRAVCCARSRACERTRACR